MRKQVAQIISISCGPLFRYRQTGQHHEHQLWAGLQADSKQVAHIISISCGPVPYLPGYPHTEQHHEHQLRVGLQKASHIISISCGLVPWIPANIMSISCAGLQKASQEAHIISIICGPVP